MGAREQRHRIPYAELSRRNVKISKQRWPSMITTEALSRLRAITGELRLSIDRGDLFLIDGGWYISHPGLLHLAKQRRCSGIHARPVAHLCDPSGSRWVFMAIVYKSPKCKGFVGYGDADPSNVSPQVRGAEMRIAETRAVSRALRKAYGIGICSVEELGSSSGPLPPAAGQKVAATKPGPANGDGHHPLRDLLCLIIRQHQLDAALVKAYAADYCDVAELRLASREQVAAFAKHLAEFAENDREALICQLNSYAPKPVSSAEGVADAGAEQKAAGAA